MSLKFGPLPEAAANRLAAATQAEVERWLEVVLTAATLEAVLGN